MDDSSGRDADSRAFRKFSEFRIGDVSFSIRPFEPGNVLADDRSRVLGVDDGSLRVFDEEVDGALQR